LNYLIINDLYLELTLQKAPHIYNSICFIYFMHLALKYRFTFTRFLVFRLRKFMLEGLFKSIRAIYCTLFLENTKNTMRPLPKSKAQFKIHFSYN
jgi:hypothetical protein